MTKLIPKLIKNEKGQICVQLRLDKFTATLPLPEHMATYTEDQLKDFFDEVVPKMAEGLHNMRRQENRKIRKKVKRCANGSTKSEPKSPGATPTLRQLH